MGTINGQSSASASWVVRGEKSGSYDLSASFHGLLMPFEESVDMTFQTQRDVEVTQGQGLHLIIQPEKAVYPGEKAYAQFILENRSRGHRRSMSMMLRTV